MKSDLVVSNPKHLGVSYNENYIIKEVPGVLPVVKIDIINICFC